MPLVEHTPITVTLTVEVDGHTLTFNAAGKVRGPRYHGNTPAPYALETTFEHSARLANADATRDVVDRAREVLRRLYPLHIDGPSQPTEEPT